jgi:hypothetical protein
MTEKLKSFFTRDIPNWALWVITGMVTTSIGVVVFASTAFADQHNDARYVKKDDNRTAWEANAQVWVNHMNMDEAKTKPILEKVAELQKKVEEANAQLSYNNRMTERNNAILERLDKR